jgi:hypothetical protein
MEGTGPRASLGFDKVSEMASLLQYVYTCKHKRSTFKNNLHVYFENEKELLTFAKNLRPYYKERVVGLTMPPAGRPLKKGTLLFKSSRGYKFLAISSWSEWQQQDVKILLNVAKSTGSEIGKRVKARLEDFIDRGESSEFFDQIRVRVEDEQILRWLQLQTGRKWKIYSLEETK